MARRRMWSSGIKMALERAIAKIFQTQKPHNILEGQVVECQRDGISGIGNYRKISKKKKKRMRKKNGKECGRMPNMVKWYRCRS